MNIKKPENNDFSSTIPIHETKPVQYKHFSCGEPVLDEYIKRYAMNHEKINIARTFVLLNDSADFEENQKNKVIGFYSLCTAQLHIEDLPQTHREKLPKYPIPASRLCRLAVDESFQHQKLGSYLLMDAIQRVLQVDRVIAIHSLIVDAKHEGLKKFYSRNGFLPLDGNGLKLFLPLSTLKKLP